MSDLTFHPRWVKPFYGHLMNPYNILRLSDRERTALARKIIEIIPELDDKILREMLWESWRPAKVAAWIIGIRKLERFTDILTQELLNKPYYASQVCFALVRLENETAIAALELYLEHFLVVPTNASEIINAETLSLNWALAALLWLDNKNKTDLATKFLDSWESFIKGPDLNINPNNNSFKQLFNDSWAEYWNLNRTKYQFQKVMEVWYPLFDRYFA